MNIVQSFSYAIKGIKNCFISETNFKIHTAFAVVALLLAVFFGVTLQQWMVILFLVGLVMAMEMMNTAIEVLCDVLHPGIHPGI